MKIEPGKYRAKIKDYKYVDGKGGKPQAWVEFGLFQGPNFSYYGNLSTPEQKEYTVKNLLTLGATQDNILDVAKGPAGGVLDMDKEFELVIEDNEWQGKVSSRIKFINDPEKRRGLQATANLGGLADLKGIAAQMIAQDPSLKAEPKNNLDKLPF